MNERYKNYQQARDAAWQLLIDCKVSSLPVNLNDICKHLGIHVYTYRAAANVIAAAGLSAQRKISDGFTLRRGEKTYIFYDDAACSLGRQRFTVAHELGHIVLGHVGDGEHTVANRDPSPKDDPYEIQANQFAARILAPACVLHAMGVTKAEDISRVCEISLSAAEFRAARLAVLEGRGKYLSHPLERQVFEQFRDYLLRQAHQGHDLERPRQSEQHP